MTSILNMQSTLIKCKVKRNTPIAINNCNINPKKHHLNQVIQKEQGSDEQRKNIFARIEELRINRSKNTTPLISKKQSKTKFLRVSPLTPERAFKTTNRVLSSQQNATKSNIIQDIKLETTTINDNAIEQPNNKNKLFSYITEGKLLPKNHHKHYSMNEPLFEKHNSISKMPIKKIPKKLNANHYENRTPQLTQRTAKYLSNNSNNSNSNSNSNHYNNKDINQVNKKKINTPKITMEFQNYYTSSSLKQSKTKNYYSRTFDQANSDKAIKEKSFSPNILPVNNIVQINNSNSNQAIVVRKRDKSKQIASNNNSNSNNNMKNINEQKNKYQLTLLSKMPSKDLLNHQSIKKKTRNSKSSIKSGNDMTKNETQSEKSILASKTIHSIAQISQTGFAGLNRTKINQDNLFIVSPADSNYRLIGICDGHGKNGHLVSQYLVELLPRVIEKEIKQKNIIISSYNNDKIKKVLDNAFVSINSKLSNDCTIDTTFSGSTCVSIVISNEKLYCANVGDSRGIIGKYNKFSNKWHYTQISRDHKPTDEDEHKRIIRFGGRVCQYRQNNGSYVGPQRIWLQKEDIPGLAMSRSFGDQIASKVGVTCEPEVKEVTFTEEDKFVLLASDGLWEYMSNDRCVEIVSKYYVGNKDSDGALKFLYKEAFKEWINNDLVIDDITIVLIFFS